jgi:uncharacterized membrane protein YkvA (DUF1232 family)
MTIITRTQWALIAILYLISPIDLVPDFILGLGWLDDLAIVLYALRQVRRDAAPSRVHAPSTLLPHD